MVGRVIFSVRRLKFILRRLISAFVGGIHPTMANFYPSSEKIIRR
jgi:hypothetical protein